MSRPEVNRSGELEIFIHVVEQGSFSGAATRLQMTPSGVSKLISRLESRLQVRLFNRSTRQLQLTPEGQLFYDQGVQILADLDEAERGAGLAHVPRGRVRINANLTFGYHFLIPLIPGFSACYPEITLDLVFTDQVVDILEQRTDVAVRAGPLKNSNLLARKLGQTRMIIVGAPDYLQRAGTPVTPADLAQHNLLSTNYVRSMRGWPLLVDGHTEIVPAIGSVQASDGEALRELALAGVGLSRLAAFRVNKDIAAGRLVPILETYNPGDLEQVHAVFVGQGGPMPLRVRVLLDYMAEHIHFDDVAA